MGPRRDDSLEAGLNEPPRTLTSGQRKGAAFLHATSAKSCRSGIGKKAERIRDRTILGQSASQQNSRSLLRPSTEQWRQQRPSSLSHQPSRQKEARVKYVLQRYQEMKQRSASVLGNGSRLKSVHSQKSGQAFGEGSTRGEVNERANNTAMGFMQTTSSLHGVGTLDAPGTRGGTASSGSLLGPARRGQT